jgi:surface polysaccharide O-acyltransferase-like enzyme
MFEKMKKRSTAWYFSIGFTVICLTLAGFWIYRSYATPPAHARRAHAADHPGGCDGVQSRL